MNLILSQALKFSEVTKTYADVTAISNLSLTVERGETVALLGGNGAGKTTFMSLALGLIDASQGQVSVMGKNAGASELRKSVRLLTQDLDFPAHLKVKEVIKLVASHYGDEGFGDLLEELSLVGILNRKTFQLSGGEKRRLGICCCLIGDPQFVFLDEPTANIDIQGRHEIYQVLSKRLRGKTLMFSSHQMQEVELLAEKIFIMNKGQLVASGNTQEIKHQYGLKSVSFKPSLQGLSFNSAIKTQINSEKVVLFGNETDAMIKEVLAQDPKASEIEILNPSLDEVVMQLWKGGMH